MLGSAIVPPRILSSFPEFITQRYFLCLMSGVDNAANLARSDILQCVGDCSVPGRLEAQLGEWDRRVLCRGFASSFSFKFSRVTNISRSSSKAHSLSALTDGFLPFDWF